MIYTLTLNPAVDYVINVPNFQEGQLNKTQQEFKYPGGKAINVSRILNELEIPSQNLGFIGGFTGQFMKIALADVGLSHSFIEVPGDTRINIKLKGTKETEINGSGPTIGSEHLDTLLDQVQQLGKQDWLVLAGSLPNGVTSDTYEDIATIASKQQTPFVVDISDKRLFDLLPYRPVLVKPNHHELGALFDTKIESVEQAVHYGKRLLNMGAQHVIVSMGGEGAILIDASGVYRAEGLKGTLVNSVGAGDSMVGGFIGKLSQDEDVVTAFRYGVACGSATAFSSDLGTREYIETLVSQVIIQSIEMEEL